MKIFNKTDGGIIQLIEKEKIQEWPIELPLKFIQYIKINKLRSYRDPKVEKDISNYLDEILKEIAAPKIKNLFNKGDTKEIINTLDIFEVLSETNSGAIRLIEDLIQGISTNTNKSISSRARKIINNLKR